VSLSLLIHHPRLNHAGKFAKKLSGEDDAISKSMLQRLDRLTVEESRITVAHTMELVYGLVSDMKEVMRGT